MIDLIEQHRDEISSICERFGVKKLELFGSAATGAFTAEQSDVDFLVEFLDNDWHHAADNWFGLLEGLESVLDRKVDLVSTPDIRNPYFLEVANRSRVELYAA